MPRLVSTRITTDDIKAGDEITFDYINPHQNIPSRVGEVISIGPKLVLVWDYSLASHPDYRAYSLGLIQNLGRIDVDDNPSPQLSWVARYKQSVINFGRKFVGLSD